MNQHAVVVLGEPSFRLLRLFRVGGRRQDIADRREDERSGGHRLDGGKRGFEFFAQDAASEREQLGDESFRRNAAERLFGASGYAPSMNSGVTGFPPLSSRRVKLAPSERTGGSWTKSMPDKSRCPAGMPPEMSCGASPASRRARARISERLRCPVPRRCVTRMATRFMNCRPGSGAPDRCHGKALPSSWTSIR